MAERPIYIPLYQGDVLVETQYVPFTWFPGMAPSQRKKSVASLHESAIAQEVCKYPLEVSSKSEVDLGVSLSAFNLKVVTEKQKREFTVEAAFQSSKKFSQGGPYTDLLYGTSIAAKKDSRLQNSGHLVAFEFFGQEWSLEPKTAFYDWLYVNALRKNEWAIEQLSHYDAFTDIEFNPQKSINCQAYSVALFKALSGRGLLKEAVESKENFLEIIGANPVNNARENTAIQPNLI